jgi:hypothetical protein
MKRLKTIFSVLTLLAAVSCAKTPSATGGQVNFMVSSNQNVADVTKSNVSDYTTLPSAENFTITIKDASNATVWSGLISEWGTGENPSQLKAGNYTVEATYGSLEEEGFDKPYFYGTASFAVTGGQTTNVPITVSLGNTIIKVSYSDNFKAYFSDYTFMLTRDNTEIAVFAKDETRGAFIDGYKITVEGEMTGELKTFSYSQEYSNLEVATAYTLAFDVNNVGSATLTVTFNDEVETVELGDIELND